MTGTILPPAQTMMLRNVANSALVLFALLAIDQQYANRATTETELANLLQIDPRTVHKKCLDLSAIGCLTGCGADRWMLTPAGRGTLFSTSPQHLRSIEESEALLSDGVVVSAQFVPLEEEEAKFAKDVYTSSSSDLRESTFCATTKQILQAAAELFDADVYLHDVILEREPEYVLGWVAKAYNDKARLSSPTSLIYRRLMDLTELPVMYRKNPTRGLPAAYLRTIGMVREAEKAERNEEGRNKKNSLADYYLSSDLDQEEPQEVYGDGFDSWGRCEAWMRILNSDNFVHVKGVSFHGRETVSVCGDVMTVNLRNIGRNQNDHIQIANEQIAPVASRIYAEQIGMSTAQVVFVLEEVV